MNNSKCYERAIELRNQYSEEGSGAGALKIKILGTLLLKLFESNECLPESFDLVLPILNLIPYQEKTMGSLVSTVLNDLGYNDFRVVPYYLNRHTYSYKVHK